MHKGVIHILVTVIAITLFCYPTAIIAQEEAGESQISISYSPAEFNIPNMLANSVQEKILTIFCDSSLADSNIIYKTQVRGDFPEYIIIDDEVGLKKKDDSFEVEFEISPDNAAEGDYELYIDLIPFEKTSGNSPVVISGQETENVTSTTAVSLGVTIPVRFHVTNEEVVQVEVTEFSARNTEVQQPLLLYYTVVNDGNVNWRPDRVEVVIQDFVESDFELIESVEADEALQLNAGKTDTFNIKVSPDLRVGSYKALLRIYYQGLVIHETESRSFSVLQKDMLKQAGDITEVNTNKPIYNQNEKIRFEAIFNNTGEMAVPTTMVVEIFRGNEYVDAVRTESVIVDPNDSVSLSKVFQFQGGGDYTLSAFVEYGLRKTSSLSTEVTVKDNGKFNWPIIPVAVAGCAVVASLTILLIFFNKRLKKRKRNSNHKYANGKIKLKKVKGAGKKKPAAKAGITQKSNTKKAKKQKK
ncbi:hypothetical protein ACFL2M_00875 [Patescibacteria group bacterium]